jgi:hypothetical protein
LKFFDNSINEQLFKDHNTFFVLTSNFLENIDFALRDRFETQFQVELPDDPKDYEMFFKSFMDVEKTRFPNEPIAGGKTLEEAWENTFKLINKLDWAKISVSFCGAAKKVNFRKLKQILRRVFSGYLDYQTTVDLLNKGYTLDTIPALRGLPLTTENIMNLPEYMGTEDDEGEGQFKLGVSKYERDVWAKAEKVLEKYKGKALPQEQYIEESTGKTKMRSVLPKEAIDILNGTAFTPSAAEEIEYTQEVDPATGKVKTKFAPKKSPAQQMEDLKGEGFEEKPLEEVEQEVDISEEKPPQTQEKQPETKKKDKSKKEEKVSSSTDYFFKYLQNKGVISADGKTVVGKSDVNKEELQKESQSKEIKGKDKFKPGVYNFGFIMVAPGYPGAKPQNVNYTDAGTVKGKK